MFRSLKHGDSSERKVPAAKSIIHCLREGVRVVPSKGLRLNNESKVLLIRKGKNKSSLRSEHLKSTIILKTLQL